MKRLIMLIALVIALLPSPVGAQITQVQGVTTSSAAATFITLTLDSTAQAGNHLICFHMSNSQAQAWTISNNGTAQTWVTATGGPIDLSLGTARAYVFYSRTLTASDVTTITVTRASGTSSSNLICGEYTDLDDSDLFEDFSSAEASSVTSHDSGDVDTTVNDTLLFGGVFSTTTASFTAFGSGYNAVDTGVGPINAAYRVLTSTGTYDFTATSAASENTETFVVAFNGLEGDPPPGGSTPKLMLMGVGGAK